MKNSFNIIISGVGGQGLITLTQIIAEAAFIEGNEVRTSELHGLSQREGSVETHIRFGKKACPVGSRRLSCGVFSPLVVLGTADFVLALEVSEALKSLPFANKNTVFLINENHIPFEGGFSKEKVIQKLNELIKNKKYLIPASEICQKELQKEVVSGIYLLGYAVFNKLVLLKPDSILKAISKVIPEKYLELNKKAFNLAIK